MILVPPMRTMASRTYEPVALPCTTPVVASERKKKMHLPEVVQPNRFDGAWRWFRSRETTGEDGPEAHNGGGESD